MNKFSNFHHIICYSFLLLFFFTFQTLAQEKNEPVAESITSHIIKPSTVEATPERIDQLEVPEGFTITKFAEGLENPRMIVTAPNGDIYITQRKPGNVLLLRDTNNDGKADENTVVIEKENAHGIAIHDGKLYLATVKEVYSAELNKDGSIGELELLIDDLPDGGQHPNRTIEFGPDDKMYISVGSTCNACQETNEEHATIIQTNLDGSERKVYAKGLRNTIGFDWHPETQELYGMDHGIDWLGDEEQKEELNLIKQDADYGWPVIYGDGNFNKADEPDSLTFEEYAAKTELPVLTHVAHSSPLDMVFYDADMFPDDYNGDAFVTFRGSWNRNPPSGYKISRIHFEDGEPVEFEDFITGFLINKESHFARLAGLAVHSDGSLIIADDTNGIIYRVAYEE